MDNEWRNDEPEVGTVARIISAESGDEWIGICTTNSNNKKFWTGEYDWELREISRWQPITTPEEQRLKAENEELKYWINNTGGPLIEKLKAEVERLREFRSKIEMANDAPSSIFLSLHNISMAIVDLRKTEAGGAGE